MNLRVLALLSLSCLLMMADLSAQERQGVPKDPNVILGRVFLDENRNGLQDEDEPGLAGVEVNDEWTTVFTDEAGYFSLRLQSDSHYVRYTLPKGYSLVNTLCLDVSRPENRQLRLVMVPVIQ